MVYSCVTASSAVISSFAGAVTISAPATRVSVTDVGRACPPAGSPAVIGNLHRRAPAHLDPQTVVTAQLAHPTRVGDPQPPPSASPTPGDPNPRRIVPDQDAAEAGILGLSHNTPRFPLPPYRG